MIFCTRKECKGSRETGSFFVSKCLYIHPNFWLYEDALIRILVVVSCGSATCEKEDEKASGRRGRRKVASAGRDVCLFCSYFSLFLSSDELPLAYLLLLCKVSSFLGVYPSELHKVIPSSFASSFFFFFSLFFLLFHSLHPVFPSPPVVLGRIGRSSSLLSLTSPVRRARKLQLPRTYVPTCLPCLLVYPNVARCLGGRKDSPLLRLRLEETTRRKWFACEKFPWCLSEFLTPLYSRLHTEKHLHVGTREYADVRPYSVESSFAILVKEKESTKEERGPPVVQSSHCVQRDAERRRERERTRERDMHIGHLPDEADETHVYLSLSLSLPRPVSLCLPLDLCLSLALSVSFSLHRVPYLSLARVMSFTASTDR